MPGFVKAVVSLNRRSLLPEDTAVNVFYFRNNETDVITPAAATARAAILADFYNAIPTGGTAALTAYMSDALIRTANGMKIDFYNTTGANPPAVWGSPVETRMWTLGAGGGTSLPGEVAFCLSYHADLTDVPETQVNPTPPPATIRPAARLRGRLFIGPLNTSALFENATTGEGIPLLAFRQDVALAGADLLAENTASYEWVGQSVAGDEFWDVVGGFTDNAFDTQRRRGEDSSSRISWP